MSEQARRYFAFTEQRWRAELTKALADVAEAKNLVELGKTGTVAPKKIWDGSDYVVSLSPDKKRTVVYFRTAKAKAALMASWKIKLDTAKGKLDSLERGRIWEHSRGVSDLTPGEFVNLDVNDRTATVLEVIDGRRMMVEPEFETRRGYDRVIVEGVDTSGVTGGTRLLLPTATLFEVSTTSYTTVIGANATVPALRVVEASEIAPHETAQRERRERLAKETAHGG